MYLKQLRPGVWRVEASSGGRTDRRRLTATVFGSKAKAEDRWRKLRDRLDQPAPPPATQHTVAQALDAWWRDMASTQAATTQAVRRGVRERLRDAFGTLTLDQLTVEAYLRVERDWRETLRPGTLALRRVVLRAALHHARRQHWLDADPLALLPPLNPHAVPRSPARTQASREPLTEAQAHALLAVLERPEWVPWRALWLCALFGGLRLGELRGLTRDAIDEAASVLLIRQQITRASGRDVTKAPKGEKARDAPVPPEVMAAVVEHLATHTHELVFPMPGGRPLDEDDARAALYAIEAAAGLPRLVPHSLRHSFVTLSIELGGGLSAVSHIAGHSNSSITQRVYTKYRRRAGRQVADRLGTLLHPADEPPK